MRKSRFNRGLFLRETLRSALILGAVLLGFVIFRPWSQAEGLALMDTLPYFTLSVNAGQTVAALTQEPEPEPFDELLGTDDIIYQDESTMGPGDYGQTPPLTAEDIEKLRDLDFLKNNFYTVDSRTAVTPSQFNVDQFLAENLKIDNSVDGPKVLIFHTHSQEAFCDSDMSLGLSEGIIGVGERLAELLEDKYGIECLHHTGQYDVLEGKSHILGAYERMEPDIRQILADNPSIQLVIDMHRDGVADDMHLATEINGKPMAKIMFFNGLSLYNSETGLKDLTNLANPYIKTNLALSFKFQLTANALYPGLTRKIYLNAYRYSLHMLPKSTLIEVGAQTNTKEEALNAMEPLARIIAEVVLE